MLSHRITDKIQAIQSSGKPTVLDVFAGCGGFSLGFKSEGFELLGAVEINAEAVKTHAYNLFSGSRGHDIPTDITTVSVQDVLVSLGVDCRRGVDVLIGGPPCQAYTRIGRAKLREVSRNDQAHILDHRATLYKQFLRFVEEAEPLAVLMENVYDIINHGGENLAEEICDELSRLGYEARYTHLNAANYGVPQLRERVFILAYHRVLKVVPKFPLPTHRVEFPRGYFDIGASLAKSFETARMARSTVYSVTPGPTALPSHLPVGTTAKQALESLPVITELSSTKQVAKTALTDRQAYRFNQPRCLYDDLMRNWPGFKSNGVYNHITRRLPRDPDIFRAMAPGDEYPEAYRLAEKLADAYCIEHRLTGPEAEAQKKRMMPPYDPTKFPNKWRKLDEDQASRTLTAHLGKDCYSHIHYDSIQGRTITIREAARLQSFPDGFLFPCAMNPSFTQIGNAVPPLLAAALARQVKTNLVQKGYLNDGPAWYLVQRSKQKQY